MPRRKIKLTAILVFATLILTLLAGLPAGAANWSTWNSMNSGTTNDLKSVWGTAATDIYAVGESGTIRHFDGATWKASPSGITNNLNCIWGNSADDIFATGDSGTMLHYDGSSWNSMTSGTTNSLNSIWGVDSGNVFAVGNAGTIVHYNGSTWSSMISGTTNDLEGVWGTAGNKVFAVGKAGTILNYNGSIWSPMSSGTTYDLQKTWGATSTDAFAVGNSGIILRYNGSTWSPMSSVTSSDLTAVWGTSGSDVFAAGNFGAIAHYNGLEWNSMTRDTLTDLSAVWGVNSSDVFATGKSGTILRYAPPAITAISPIQGDQGTTLEVTLTGTNLTNVNDIRFGAGIAVNSFTTVNPTQLKANITIVSNAIAGPRDLSVTTTAGRFDLPASFTVKQALPILTSVNPDQEKQGGTINVTLSGSNLTTTSALQFGPGIAVNSFTAISSDQLTANISLAADAATGTRDVSVTTGGGSFILPGSFTVQPAIPVITSVSPAQGNQVKTLDITLVGTSLTGASEVKLGTGIVVNKFSVISSNQLTANITIAAGTAIGTRDVSVTTPGGSFTLPNGFSVKQALPIITSVNPDQGSQGATLNVTINGANFNGTSEVRLGADIAVHSFNVLNSNEITANITIVASAAIGAREAIVTTPGGSSALPNGFTVTQSLPVIASVNPNEGSQDTTISVIISGSNFNGTTAVSFGNDITVEGFNNLSPTQLKVNIVIDKDATTGARDITITTPGGSSVLGNGFNIKQGALGSLMLALIWTGIGIIIVLFIIVINLLRRRRGAGL